MDSVLPDGGTVRRVAGRPVIGVALASALLATACTTTSAPTDSRPVTSAAADTTAAAIERLKAGTAFVDQISFLADVVIGEGQVTTKTRTDNVNKRATSIIATTGLTVEIRMIDDDVYMLAANLPGALEGWMTLDPAKIPAGFAVSFERGKNDPGGSARLFNAITSAHSFGTEISGTIDIVTLGTGNGISFRANPGAEFPDSVRSQKFRATLDGHGRLVTFAIPGSQGVPSATLRYGEFGVPVEVSPPRQAEPAPEALYPQMGLR